MLKVYTGFNMAHVADEIMNTFYDYIHSGDHYTDHSLVNSEVKIFESKNVLFEYPECYVHPIHFKNLSRLIVHSINKGINVTLLTNNDFIIRYLNAHICFSNKNTHGHIAKVMKKYNYCDNDILKPSDIIAFDCCINKNKIEITSTGMKINSFDEVTINLNQLSDNLLYGL